MFSLLNKSKLKSLVSLGLLDKYVSNKSDFSKVVCISVTSGLLMFSSIQFTLCAPNEFRCSFISLFLSCDTSDDSAIFILLFFTSSEVSSSICVSNILQYCGGGISSGKNFLPAFHIFMNLCSDVAKSIT